MPTKSQFPYQGWEGPGRERITTGTEKSNMISFEPLYELGTFLEIELPGIEEKRRYQLQRYIVKHDGVWYGFDGLEIPEADVRKYAHHAA